MMHGLTSTARLAVLILALALVALAPGWTQTSTQMPIAPPQTLGPTPNIPAPATPGTGTPAPTLPPLVIPSPPTGTTPGTYVPGTVVVPNQNMPVPTGVALPSSPGPLPLIPQQPYPVYPPAPTTPPPPVDPFTGVLPIFGHTLFSTNSNSALPPQSSPVSDAYVLGPGDVVTLHVWTGGNLQVTGAVQVDPEGNLFLQDVGRVGVQGLTLSAVRALLRSRYGKVFQEFTLEVAISQMRTVDVYVIGEVAQPGKYTLPGNATVFTALFAAGGPTATGSLRTVKLTRADNSLQMIDFYDYLLQGKRVADVPLQPGDTLNVPLVGPLVGVAGAVKRVAMYELKGSQTLAQALDMAGGLQAMAYAPRLEIRRYFANASFQTLDVDISKPGVASGFVLQDGDRIVADAVTYLLTNSIELDGQVYRPGLYQMRPGLTLSGLLHDAEGLMPTAYTTWGTLLRLNSHTAQYENVIINPLNAFQGQAGADLPLQAMDKVMIYARTDVEGSLTVNISGHVRTPEDVPFVPNMTIKDAVLQAGGLMPDALTSRALLLRVRPDMSREVLTVPLALALAGDPTQNLPLKAYDRLTIFAQTDIGTPPQVAINGQINNPGSFPRREDMTLSQLLTTAGGVIPGANGTIKITHGRYTDHPVVETATFTVGPSLPTPTPDLVLRDDDFVAVMGAPDYIATPVTVQILGQVGTPGPYALENPQAHPQGVWDLLKRSGGLLQNAYGPGIVVYRKSTSLLDARQQGQYTHVINNQDQQQRELHLETAMLPPAGSTVIGAAVPPLASALSGPQPAQPTAPSAPTPTPAPATSSAPAPTPYGAPTPTLVPAAGSSPTAITPTTGLPVISQTPGVTSPTTQPIGGLQLPTGPGGAAAMLAPPAAPLVTPATPTAGVIPASGAAPLTAAPAAGSVASSAVQQVTLGLAQAFSTQNAIMIAVPPRDLTTTTFSTAIPLDWKRLQASQGKDGDIILFDGDVVYIPTTPTLVYVAGAVQNQGALRFREGMRVVDATEESGGLGKDAVLHSAIVIHANGQVDHVTPKDKLAPGDIVIVPTQYIIQKAREQSGAERVLTALANAALFFRLF